MSFYSKRRRYAVALAAMAVLPLAVDRADGVVIASGVDGRFIRVQNIAGPRTLQLGEIEAFLAGVTPSGGVVDNVNDQALISKGASFESSIGTGGHGSDDAPLNGVVDIGGATWTRDSAGEYVADLGTTRNLGSLRVWQRGDACCNDRLQNFNVSLLADNGAGQPGAVVYSADFAGTAPSGSFAAFELPVARTIVPGGEGATGVEMQGSSEARFVRVRNDGGTRTLQIGELEAFLQGVTPSASGLSGNDLSMTFESESGTGGHGASTAPVNNIIDSGADTWTRDNAGYYMADLDGSFDVETVRVWQRGDACCDDRLRDFTVTLLADNNGLPGMELGSASFAGIVPRNDGANGFAELSFDVQEQFTIGAMDTLRIEIDPLLDASDLLQIGASGMGALMIEPGATLELVLLNPLSGPDTFDILDFGSITGSFSNIVNPGDLDLSRLLIDGTITATGSAAAIPEPTSLLLTALTSAALCLGRRRRAM